MRIKNFENCLEAREISMSVFSLFMLFVLSGCIEDGREKGVSSATVVEEGENNGEKGPCYDEYYPYEPLLAECLQGFNDACLRVLWEGFDGTEEDWNFCMRYLRLESEDYDDGTSMQLGDVIWGCDLGSLGHAANFQLDDDAPCLNGSGAYPNDVWLGADGSILEDEQIFENCTRWSFMEKFWRVSVAEGDEECVQQQSFHLKRDGLRIENLFAGRITPYTYLLNIKGTCGSLFVTKRLADEICYMTNRSEPECSLPGSLLCGGE